MSAPLKPWETALNEGTLHNHAQSPMTEQFSSVNSAVGGTVPSLPDGRNPIQGAGRPALPPRPSTTSSLTPSSFGTGYGYGSGLGGYSGMSGYGGFGGGMYASPYMGAGYGGGYSTYNNLTGYNSLNPNGNNSLVNHAEANAQGAFQSVGAAVSAVSSISMMLESTYMALFNSFRAVLGVADQFSRLKLQLMDVASSFAVFKFIRWLYRRLLVLLRLRKAGLPEDVWAKAVASSASEAKQRFPGQQKSSWPFVAFVAFTGLLIRHIVNSMSGNSSSDGAAWADGTADHVVGECKFDFAASQDDELSVQQGQRVNLAPAELQPRLRENDWLVASDGVKSGIVPASYIRILGTRKGKPKPPTDAAGVPPSPETSHVSTES